jgi:hypothetical protein
MSDKYLKLLAREASLELATPGFWRQLKRLVSI